MLIFEVYLPKKVDYYPFLTSVLDSFFDVEKIKAIPEIQRILKAAEGLSDFDVASFVEGVRDVISGYSIYEVDGRFFVPPRKRVDERTLVIRFIIHDPRYEAGMRDDVTSRSKEIIRYLITKRFAEEIGLEDQIWFVEYQHCLLQRWVKNEQHQEG